MELSVRAAELTTLLSSRFWVMKKESYKLNRISSVFFLMKLHFVLALFLGKLALLFFNELSRAVEPFLPSTSGMTGGGNPCPKKPPFIHFPGGRRRRKKTFLVGFPWV